MPVASRTEENWQVFKSSSQVRPLKLSHQGFCHPGSMKMLVALLKRHQSAKA